MMTAKRSAILLGSALAAALGGCATVPDLSPDERALVASTWYLDTVADAQEEIRLRPQLSDRHTMTFQRDGGMILQLDCNRGTSRWDAFEGNGGSGRLSVGQVASTRALCPSPSYGERMAAQLPQADFYQLGPDGRTLTIRTPAATFSFVAR